MNVLVFADNQGGKVAKAAAEAATYGAKIASDNGGTAKVITYGALDQDGLNKLAGAGIADVLHCADLNEMDPARLAKLVVAAAEESNADLVVFSHDYTGKSVASMVSAKMKAGMVSGAVDYPSTDGSFSVRKAVFSGKAFSNVKINTAKKVISLLPNSVDVQRGEGTANVTAFSPDLGAPSLTVIEQKTKGGEGINLTEAELVVSAGRGLKGPENWGMVEEMANLLGAATACSRPVADIGWRPHHEHVGQTGIAIRPNLYIAIGISGAIQHLAGVNGSKVIVVINTDPEAPFFKAADYGIVGDAFEVVPKLNEALKSMNLAQ